jgi:hypothetical protein
MLSFCSLKTVLMSSTSTGCCACVASSVLDRSFAHFCLKGAESDVGALCVNIAIF